jgi:hypothetical protein
VFKRQFQFDGKKHNIFILFKKCKVTDELTEKRIFGTIEKKYKIRNADSFNSKTIIGSGIRSRNRVTFRERKG